MSGVVSEARQQELRKEFSLVRTRLPPHVQNPDPNIYRSNNYVALDFETTVYRKGLGLYNENSIVFSSWELGPDHPDNDFSSTDTGSGDSHKMFYSWRDEFGLGKLVRHVEAADFLIAHNAKFELQWLRRCGVDIAGLVVWDTMLGEYVIGGNRWQWKQLSLSASVKRRLNVQDHEGKEELISQMFKVGLCSTEIPASWLNSYCRRDTRLARKLFVEQRAYMNEEPRLLPVMFSRCLATPVLAHLETTGMTLDEPQIRTMIEEKERDYAALQNDLEELTGGINTNSSKQLADFLYGPHPDAEEPYEVEHSLGFAELAKRGDPIRTATGKRKTDEATLNSLKATTKAQKRFLDLQKQSKALHNELSKYLRKFDQCCREVGGHLQGQFNQTNTRTQRLSSSGLEYKTQFQNFPRVYKPIFRARHDGWLVGEADGAQLEFRVAAHLGRDGVALDDLLAGTDIHSVTAGIIGCTRQEAKEHTFKPLYGGSSGTARQKRYYEFFKEKYKGIAGAQQRWINSVLAEKELETEWGLKYYWPNTRMTHTGYITNTTSICNYPVQAFATAEIIPAGLIYFWHYARAAGLQMTLVNTVHDSIIVELPPEEVEHFHVLAQICLIDEVYTYLDGVYQIQLTVPLGAGVMTGKNWADKAAKDGEITYNAPEGLYDTSSRNAERSQH